MNRQDLKRRINLLEKEESIPGSSLTLEAPLWRICLWMFFIIGGTSSAAAILGIYYPHLARFLSPLIMIFVTIPALVIVVINPIKKQNATLWEVAHTDPLTKVFNRLSFMSYLSGEFCRASKNGQSLCLILIDVDHFKKVNDTYGHSIGDLVLMAIGTILKGNVRDYDMVARYGGEEFAIILASTPIEDALVVAERFRAAVEKTQFTIMQSGVTISAGVVAFPGEGIKSMEDLIKEGDKALYFAKESGRNKVVNSTEITDNTEEGI